MYSTYVKVHGISAKFETDDNEFSSFVKKNYAFFIRDKMEHVNLYSKLVFRRNALANQSDEYKLKVGSGIEVGKNHLKYRDGESLSVCLLPQNDGLSLESTYMPPLKLRLLRLARQMISNSSIKYQTYQSLMRIICHYPLFWLLEKRRLFTMHASAVERDGEGTIFFGLNGVGKTTLALYLSLYDGYRMLSDNFLFYDSEKIYGFPERVRVPARSAKILNIRPTSRLIFEKYHLDLDSSQVCSTCLPSKVLLVTRGKTTELTQIPPDRLMEVIRNFHDFLGELHSSSFLSALGLLSANSDRYLEQRGSLDSILHRAKCYVFSIGEDDPLGSVAEKLSEEE